MQQPPFLPEPRLNDNAREILNRRYLIKDDDGAPAEKPKDMFWRVASTIAQEDKKYGATEVAIRSTARVFYYMMSQGFWLPNSPTLMNAGRPLGQLSACFVLPVNDCLSNGQDGIYDTLTNMALIHQSGGGTGFSFSRLRPSGSIVKSTTGVASGPVSFMSLYDASTNVVKQGGTRRGANMGILRVDHPDILDFIECKSDTSKITNFNISVAVTDKFMFAVEQGDSYDLIDHENNKVGELNAREVFETLLHRAWSTGEPGLFFIDEANRHNPVPHMGDYEATNPCGEQPLLAYDTCNLGSLNIDRFVIGVPGDKFINWSGMAKSIRWLVHFMDNVIDANRHPIDKIQEVNQRIRRIGCGVMGWADALISLGIPYDSDEALTLADQIAGFFVDQCYKASEELAEERGVFPEWEDSIWGPNNDSRKTRRLRHCNVTTVAPTGTISIIAGCSSGIEPLFAVAFMRNQAGAILPDVHPIIEQYIKKDAPPEWERVLSENGHIDFPWVDEEARRIFRTSGDINASFHVEMQAAWQKHIDSAISKTINFPANARPEDVRRAFVLAYELKCKGITVYRDGSRPDQVLSTGKTESLARELQNVMDVEDLARAGCSNGACAI